MEWEGFKKDLERVVTVDVVGGSDGVLPRDGAVATVLTCLDVAANVAFDCAKEENIVRGG